MDELVPEIKKYQQALEQALVSMDLPKVPATLYDPIRYILSLQAKRLRPVLTLIANDLYNGNQEEAINAAVAIEIFHNFTLVHDDIMDNATLRRGEQTVHVKWNLPSAILSGDVMLVLVYRYLSFLPQDKFLPATKLINDTAIKVCEGQQWDMEFESKSDISIDQYITMIGLKTAVLLGTSLKIGALLTQASENEQDLLYNFGYNLGISFQIQDDLLDSFGNEKFGKAIGGDIAANKKTFLTLKAMQIADDKTNKELFKIYHQSDIESDEKIAKVMDIYQQLDIKMHTEAIRDAYFEKALSYLQRLDLADSKKEILLRLSHQLLNRTT